MEFFYLTNRSRIPNSRCRSASCSACVTDGSSEGSSTSNAQITARAAANGHRTHHSRSVEGRPCRIDFSRADSALIAANGHATSISFGPRATTALASDALTPRHIVRLREMTNASWEALAVGAASYTGQTTAAVLVRSPGEVAFVAANGLAPWPRGSSVQPGGVLDRALRCKSARARPEVYRYSLGGAEELFCDTLRVSAGLAIAVVSPRCSDGGLSILKPVEPAWKDREEFCAWCNAERDVGWCHECSGQRCRECERCGCDVPISNPVCPRCFLVGPIRTGSEVCVDCEAGGPC